jgi:hypothetical protein
VSKIKTSKDVTLIGELRAKRYSFASIGRHFGVSYQRIQQICEDHGFTMVVEIQEDDLCLSGDSSRVIGGAVRSKES